MYNVVLDKSEKWLDKQYKIAMDCGISKAVDCCKLQNISKTGKRAEILFMYAQDSGWNETEKRTVYTLIPITTKQKTVKFENGKLIISVFGLPYQIGTYTEA